MKIFSLFLVFLGFFCFCFFFFGGGGGGGGGAQLQCIYYFTKLACVKKAGTLGCVFIDNETHESGVN